LRSPLKIVHNCPQTNKFIRQKTVTKTVTRRETDRIERGAIGRSGRKKGKRVTPTPGQLIGQLGVDQSVRLEKIEHGGSLEARRLKSGNVALYWRYTEAGKTDRMPIGTYDPSAPPKSLKPTARGYSIAAARETARDLAKRNAETPGGLRADRQRKEAAAQAAAAVQAARAKYTLQALCTEYCNWLKRQGKVSHSDARNIFKNHLLDPSPGLAALPASQIEKRQVIEPIRKLTEAGHASTARKLRSYLRAAYACAVKADSDAALPSGFSAFGVMANPVDGTAAIKTKADKNPLSLADLRKYWEALKHEPGVIGAALRLQVLSGGQRVAQLARLHERDISTNDLRLLDPKGKRSEPRPHLLPITKQMRLELGKMPEHGYKLSTDGGATAMHPTSITAWASDVARRAKINGFQLKRVRSGIETRLAELGIPLHIRGQLQSHGISGVQATSYDAHTYLNEKREALQILYGLLVRPLPKKARAGSR
jgi:hypothetical protein